MNSRGSARVRRTKFLFDRITDFDNIRLAWLKARRGKGWTFSVRRFSRDVNGALDRIRCRLLSEYPAWGKYRQFTITDPKERVISAAPFEDRVMHHAIMNVLEPVFERQMVFHTYACRRGKGTHRAVLQAHELCRRNPFVLKLDVRKYFDSIDHKILKEMLRRLIKDAPALRLLDSIIDSYAASESPARGIPIGNLTSQFFANLYLSPLDHLILERTRATGLVRYMDDLLVFGGTRRELRLVMRTVEDFCRDRLSLTTKEPILVPTERGVPFLGYLVQSGGIRLLRAKERAKRRALSKLAALHESGAIDGEAAAARMNAVCNVIESSLDGRSAR